MTATLSLEAHDREALLVDFLNEIIFLAERDQRLYRRATVEQSSTRKIATEWLIVCTYACRSLVVGTPKPQTAAHRSQRSDISMKTTKFVLPLTVLLAACGFDSSSTEEATGQSSEALSATSSTDDAVGDSTHAAAYMDVVSAKLREGNDGTLHFSMELAGVIPEAPSEGVLLWPFHIDSSPAAPGGLYVDYIVRVRWLAGAFEAHVVNRATGAATLVPLTINGATIKVEVDPALLGNLSTFQWNASTRPTPTVPYSDFAPSCATAASGGCLLTFTSKF